MSASDLSTIRVETKNGKQVICKVMNMPWAYEFVECKTTYEAWIFHCIFKVNIAPFMVKLQGSKLWQEWRWWIGDSFDLKCGKDIILKINVVDNSRL